jgi:hypothetical protein
MSGWIKVHRKMLQWEWFDDPNTFRLFMYLLMAANYKPSKWRGREIEVGQLLTGLYKLQENTGISIQSIRTSLDKLKSTGEITIQSTNRFRIITIVNYSSYQDIDKPTNKPTNKPPNKQLTNNQQTTNNIQEDQEYKKERNKEYNPPTPLGGKTKRKSTLIKSTADIPGYRDITPNYFVPLNEWLAYKADMGKGYKSLTAIRSLIKQYPTTEKLSAAVTHSMSNNYQGCFAPNSNGYQPKQSTYSKNMQQLKTQLEQNSGLTFLEDSTND